MTIQFKHLWWGAAPAVALGFVALHPGRAIATPTEFPLSPSAVAPSHYKVDPVHSGVGFEIVHMGLAHVQGRFTKFDGHVMVDHDNMANSSVEFTVDVSSVDTAVGPRDDHLRSADYFDATKFPTMKFKSTSVKETEKGWVVNGNLTIKDQTKPMTIGFKFNGPMEDPRMGKVVGVIAEPFVVKRSDFKVGSTDKMPNGVMPLSDEVFVRVSFEAKAQ
jgi:polyisoprenoid-binding protein YceI